LPLQRFALFSWQLSGPSPGVCPKYSRCNCRKRKKLIGVILYKNGSFKPRLCEYNSQKGSKGGRNTVTLFPAALMEELPYYLIYRFFYSIHSGGIQQMNMMLGAAQVESGPHIIECPGASILYRFDNGAQACTVLYSS
jgi:hypothetical protein